jgi:hypothetical protein
MVSVVYSSFVPLKGQETTYRHEHGDEQGTAKQHLDYRIRKHGWPLAAEQSQVNGVIVIGPR